MEAGKKLLLLVRPWTTVDETEEREELTDDDEEQKEGQTEGRVAVTAATVVAVEVAVVVLEAGNAIVKQDEEDEGRDFLVSSLL